MSCRGGSDVALSAPLDVYWSITKGCNLECSFCFTSSGPGTTEGDLTVEERAQVLRMILDAGVLRVVLTGGEPFTVPEILDIVAALRERGIGVKITTNGTLLRPPVVARLAELGVRLQFSIEHHDPRVNDALMGGRDAWERIFEGMRRARAAGIPCEVKITLQRDNAKGLGPLYELLHEIGVEKIDASELVPLGRAVDRWSELETDPRDLEAAAREAEAANASGIRVDFSSARLKNKEAGVPALCSLGSPRPRTVLIDEEGNLRPCAASQSFGWRNRVLEHGLLGAWDRIAELGKYRDADSLEGECRTCDLVAECKGGCRGVAYASWGHGRGPDPYCPRVGRREGRRFFGRRVSPVALVFPDGTREAPEGLGELHPGGLAPLVA